MRDTSPTCPEPDFGDGRLTMARQTVRPDWIDYNGHMNVAYYTLAFDKAFDDFLENWMGIGESFVARSRLGPMALQTQICYLGELLEGEGFNVRVWLVDHDDKRMHFFGEMIAEKDALAMELYEEFDELPMPNLGLNDVDAAALIDFMETESREIIAAQTRKAKDPHAAHRGHGAHENADPHAAHRGHDPHAGHKGHDPHAGHEGHGAHAEPEAADAHEGHEGHDHGSDDAHAGHERHAKAPVDPHAGHAHH